MRTSKIPTLLAGLALTALPAASFAFVSVGVSINIAPPALPVYEQPPCPAVGYMWTPGYWAYADDGYYWVPGTWVMAPEPGLLWTPGYWGWVEGAYLWHGGYWGPHVGFYGGVNYGFGYTGSGFEGGYWRGRDYYYNRSVSNINTINVTNVYNKTVINNVTVNRVSYNGGTGGLAARPTTRQLQAEHEHHVDFTQAQREQEHMASTNRDLRASVNGGKPRIAATARPAVFTGSGIVGARAAGGPVHSAEPHVNHADRPPSAGTNAMHAAGPANSTFGQPGSGHTARSDRPPGAGSSATFNPGANTTHTPQQRFNPPNADRHTGARAGEGESRQPDMHATPAAPGAHSMSQPPTVHSTAAPRVQGAPPSQTMPHPQGPQGGPHPQGPQGNAHPQGPQGNAHPQGPQGGPHPQGNPRSDGPRGGSEHGGEPRRRL